MKYRRNVPYDSSKSNESHADQIEHALTVCTDRNGEQETSAVYTDVSDMLASVRHFCDRAGINYGDVDGHAYAAYVGDHETDPVTVRDSVRFPEDGERDELTVLKGEVKAALEGDSNDAEHDALAAVAEHFGVTYTTPDI